MLNTIYYVGEQLASCPLGQIIFSVIDRTLWIFETSTQWFLKNEEKKGPLIRPLPWILFIPFLIWLRFLKIGLNLISFIRGKEIIPVPKVVKFIQIRRHNICAVKYAGLQNFAIWKTEQEKKKKVDGECIVLKLLGVYWLLSFTGLGRFISSVPSPKTKQEKELQSKDELVSSEPEQKVGNRNHICEQSVRQNNPANNTVADKSDDNANTENNAADLNKTGDTQNTSDCLVNDNNANDVKHNENNASNEAVIHENNTDNEDYLDSSDASYSSDTSISSDTSSTLSLETAEAGSESTSQTFYSSSNISPDPTPIKEHTNAENDPEQSILIEEIPNQISLDTEQNKIFEDKLVSPSQNENIQKQVKNYNKTSIESWPSYQGASSTNNDESKKLQADSSPCEIKPVGKRALEEKLKIDPTSSQEIGSTQQILEQTDALGEITNLNQSSHNLSEEKKNEQSTKDSQSKLKTVNLEFKGEGNSKTNSHNIPYKSSSVESAEKETDDPSVDGSKQFHDTIDCSSKQGIQCKEKEDENIQPNLSHERTRETKQLRAIELLFSLANDQLSRGDPNIALIYSEQSAALPPHRKSDPAIGSETSTQSTKTGNKSKRRFSDFLIKKKKT